MRKTMFANNNCTPLSVSCGILNQIACVDQRVINKMAQLHAAQSD